MKIENVLKINEDIVTDDSIESYEVHEYTPVTGTNLNNCGEIRIVIETQDIFTHPSESYLIIEGTVTKKDGTLYAEDDKISFGNNGLMHLFQSIRYDLSGREIESMNNPGQGTTMLGLLKYPRNEMRFFWQKDDKVIVDDNHGFDIRQRYLIQNSDPKGTFGCQIPLKHIFEFMEDYN